MPSPDAEDAECHLCCERPANTALAPCGHVVCGRCVYAMLIAHPQMRCPFCRAVVADTRPPLTVYDGDRHARAVTLRRTDRIALVDCPHTMAVWMTPRRTAWWRRRRPPPVLVLGIHGMPCFHGAVVRDVVAARGEAVVHVAASREVMLQRRLMLRRPPRQHPPADHAASSTTDDASSAVATARDDAVLASRAAAAASPSKRE